MQPGEATSLAGLIGGQQPEVDAEEVRRWQACDLSDRRALVRAAYLRAEIGASGNVYLVRHPCSEASLR